MVFEAAAWRQEQEWHRDVALAWHIAAFTRCQRLPSLKELLNPGETKVLTGEEKAKRAEEFERLKVRMGATNVERKHTR
jgi:hypothetical protein